MGWGEETAVTTQVNLYIFSRVVLTLLRTAGRRSAFPAPRNSYRLAAAACWAVVMCQFEADQPIQPSMHKAMHFIYRESEQAGGWFGRTPLALLIFTLANAFRGPIQSSR